MSVSASEHLLDWLMFSPRRLTPDAAAITPAKWDALVASAVAHTVAPQLFQRLQSESRVESVPTAVVQCAFVAMVRQKGHVTRLPGELAAALHALNASGITPILLKGAHLATLTYPEASHRPMADLDLLVRYDELGAAEEALRQIGYETDRSESMAESAESHQHIPPLTRSDSFPIELHWTLVKPSHSVRIDLDQLWGRSVPAAIGGAFARVLSIEDVLLYVCLHSGVVHQFGEKGLRPLFDIMAILERHGSSLDWNAVQSRAHEWRIEGSTYVLFELARRYCGAPIPELVLAGLKPAKLSAAVLDAAREQLFEAPGLHLPVHPEVIALAFNRPRFIWALLSRSKAISGDAATVTGQARSLFSRYGGFLWESLRRNRHLLGVVIRRTWRHIVLGAWLIKTEQQQ